jgi:hypothetical protein
MPVKAILGRFEDAAQATTREQRASAAVSAKALHQCMMLFMPANDRPQFDLTGRSCEHHTPARTSNRANEAHFRQELHDLVKMMSRDGKFTRQAISAHMCLGRARQSHEHA